MKKPFNPRFLPHKDIEWEPLIPLIGAANRALAHYDGALYGVPNPAVLLSPMTTQEAVLSSRIEGTLATLGDVLKFEAGEEPKQESRKFDIEEINNYREALRHAERALKKKPFNLNLLLELHSILLDSVRGRDKGRGKFRTVQNWIGEYGTPMEKAAYIPPEPSRIMPLMDNWEKYYHMDRPDPLVQLAVVHAQFEIIHPFLDGNGRLGRILIPLYLFERKILRQPMFYLSGYLETHRDDYLAALRDLGESEGGWNRWISFFLQARAIMDLYVRLKDRVIELTHSKFAVPMLDILFVRPVIRSSEFAEHEAMPSKPMIASMLSDLKKDGILKTIRPASGRRSEVLAFSQLINLAEGKKVI
jgi:Fic family protein